MREHYSTVRTADVREAGDRAAALLSCPRCRGRLRFVAVLFDRAEIERLLTHLHIWADPLPPHPPRGPPEHAEMLDFP